MKNTKRIISVILAVVLVAVLLSGCGNNKAVENTEPAKTAPADVEIETEFSEGGEAAEGGQLILQCWSDPTNINFYADYGAMGCSLYWSCGANLCVYKGGELYGLLLKSWELSDDGLTWTMHIRDNAGWSDGEPITVDDIIFSVEYFRQDTFQDYIFQADTMYFSETPVYEKVDDYTYTVTTTVPYATIFDFYAVNFFVIPEHVFKDVPAAEFHTTDVNSTPGEIVCGGPFKITEYKIGEYVKCDRNEYFWDDVALDTLYWRVAGDVNSMYEALMAGDLDFTFLIGSKYQEAVDAGMQIVRTNGASYAGFGMNTKDEILSDINIRKAIEYIYDQQLYIDQALGGQGEEYHGLAHNMRYDDPESCVQYSKDLDKAKELIEASGWEIGSSGFYEKDGKTLSITFSYEADYDDYTAMILQTMFEGTGIDFQIQGYEYSVLSDNFESGNWQMGSVGANMGPDPANYYDNYLNSYMFGYYRSETLDQLWIDGMSTADDAERQAVYSKLQGELTDAAVWLPMPASWGYYAGNATAGLDEAMFTSTGMFVYFNKLYKISE